MVFGEYNYEEDIAVQREEAAEKAAEIATEVATVKANESNNLKFATKMLARGKTSEEVVSELMDIFDLDESTARKAVEAATKESISQIQ